MGDLNNPSPRDGAAGMHRNFDCTDTTMCPEGSCEWVCEDGRLDYDAINIILNEGLLIDLCWVGNATKCAGTYPTESVTGPRYPWPVRYPALRIDYILANHAFVELYHNDAAAAAVQATTLQLFGLRLLLLRQLLFFSLWLGRAASLVCVCYKLPDITKTYQKLPELSLNCQNPPFEFSRGSRPQLIN